MAFKEAVNSRVNIACEGLQRDGETKVKILIISEKIQVFSELFQREERVAHLTNADRISRKYAKQPFS